MSVGDLGLIALASMLVMNLSCGGSISQSYPGVDL